MLELRPMTQDEYDIYLQRSIVEYAEDKIKAGNWPEEGAIERSKKEFENYLPDGLRTPNQNLCTIYDLDKGLAVGIIWYGNLPGSSKPVWFIYDFYINEEQRRNGYGKKALASLEDLARQNKITSIQLHVFGFNIAARNLYERAGYEITNINMERKVSG